MDEEAKDNYKLMDDIDAPEVQSFFANCTQFDWSLSLPGIIGEDQGKKFSVQAEFGKAVNIF